MNMLYNRLANWKLTLLLLGINLVFALYLFPASNLDYRLPDDPNIIDLQLSFTQAKFTGIVQAWVQHKGIEGIEALRTSIVNLDFIYPLVYALFLASLYALSGGRNQEVLSPAQKAMFALPFFAGLADWIENSIHLILLGRVQSPADLEMLPAELILAASLFAAVKLALITLSALASLYSGLRLVYRRVRK